MDVLVCIIGGEIVLVIFIGVGYDECIMGDIFFVKDVGSIVVFDK